MMSLMNRRSGAEVLESRRRMLSLMDPRREGSRSSEGRSLNTAWVKGSRSALILLGTVLLSLFLTGSLGGQPIMAIGKKPFKPAKPA